MSDERIEQYNLLCADRDKNRKWFSACVVIFCACIVMAFNQGAANGWAWLLAALFSMFFALWSLIEFKHYDVLLALHLLPSELISR